MFNDKVTNFDIRFLKRLGSVEKIFFKFMTISSIRSCYTVMTEQIWSWLKVYDHRRDAYDHSHHSKRFVKYTIIKQYDCIVSKSEYRILSVERSLFFAKWSCTFRSRIVFFTCILPYFHDQIFSHDYVSNIRHCTTWNLVVLNWMNTFFVMTKAWNYFK